MTVSRLSSALAALAAAGMWAAPAAAHPPEECRTTLESFSAHAATFAESRKIAGPVLERLFAAWDEVEAADGHARRHATIYRHFVAEFPGLRVHLAAEVESSAEAVAWARTAIFCLTRDRTTE